MTAPVSEPTVLVVDDEKNIRRSIEIALSDEGLNVLLAHDAAAALRILRDRIVDVLILDIRLGDVDGISFFKTIQSEWAPIPTIFISGNATLTQAAQAVRIGAFDFLEKPFSPEKIAITVQRCLEFSAVKERLRLVEPRDGETGLVGNSPAIRAVVNTALKVAKTTATVLITGESGTGKELVANVIHEHSGRKDGPFVKVNCSAIPDNLIESELFGHLPGSFTGAGNKRGLFELAHRGVIFLDEVADLSLSAQAKILRVLQSGEIQKIGSEKTVQVDVRIVSATHKALENQVSAGAFRDDLLYRLNVVPIRVPSLRERVQDIPLLAAFFARRACQKNNLREKPVDEEVFAALKRYQWPGNIRELQNVMERMLIMSGDRICFEDLPDYIAAPADTLTSASDGLALRQFRDKAEREFIIRVLKRNQGNITQAALELRVGRPYLHKRLAMLGIAKTDWLL
jgi:two-component system nitrogen regulation response regulator NtrX